VSVRRSRLDDVSLLLLELPGPRVSCSMAFSAAARIIELRFRLSFSRFRSLINVRIEAAVRSGFTNSRRAAGRPAVEIRRSILPFPSAFAVLVDAVVDRWPSAHDPNLKVADASASASRASLAAFAASLCRLAIRWAWSTSSLIHAGKLVPVLEKRTQIEDPKK
jgi:hypothetical protein